MKYDYTSKITAQPWIRQISASNNDAHEHLHTWHVKHWNVHKITRIGSNHRRCRRHHYRGASLIFLNTESNRRGRKSLFNDRAPGTSIRPDPRPFTAAVLPFSILNYARRESVIITAFVTSTRNVSPWKIFSRRKAVPRYNQTYYTLHLFGVRTRVHVHACDTGLDCLHRLVIEWLTAGLYRVWRV